MASFVKDAEHTARISFRSSTAQECMSLQDNTVGSETLRIGPFESDFQLTVRQRAILHNLERYYTPERLHDVLVPLLQQRTSTSLRACDWLVTNYSKKHNVVCQTKGGMLFNIHQGYRNALSMNKRRNFDPFRRRMRIRVYINDTEFVESTVGQLNFIYWATEHGVMDYLRDNIEDIDREMNETTQESKRKKSEGSSQKRAELSKAPTSRCMVYTVGSTVRFS